MPKKVGLDPAQFDLFATPLEAMIPADAEVRVVGLCQGPLPLATQWTS